MLKRLEIAGFKSFAKKTTLDFASSVTAIVGPNGSGKSNVAEAFRFALGEQSMKSMRGKRAEDLIFNGSHSAARSNRASVTIVFDNSRRAFKIDYDEVAIERAVMRDGASDYSINGSKVRLRDIEELLAGANIGDTGHHIISQGEADRILLASARERREMLEDALGLKIYEFKKHEAQKKLEKTEENISQVNSLRREIAPHLKFLQSQVDKLARAEELARDLVALAQAYFANEDWYLVHEKKENEKATSAARRSLEEAAKELGAIEEAATTDAEGHKRLAEVRKIEQEIERIASSRAALSRKLGQVEGALGSAKRRSAEAAREPYAKVPREELAALQSEIEKQTGDTTSIESARASLAAIRSAIRAFVERFVSKDVDILADEEKSVFSLENEQSSLLAEDKKLSEEHEKSKNTLARARDALASHDEAGKEMRRRILDLAQKKAHQENEVTKLEARAKELLQIASALEDNKAEVVAIAGRETVTYHQLTNPPEEDRQAQEERKKKLERLKIRLEEAGGTGEEIKAEYKEVSEREQFLSRELDDLAQSATGLKELIGELETELEKHFAEGLKQVNASFAEFFALMFGGGGARLTLEEPEEPEEGEEDEEQMEEKKDMKAGIEISVNLPKKRVQSLLQLSGGERALTSIALIFAMSQVNPPPFLILDETDAALDEANSRRYGDMIESLAKKSQLIVITHNRETMSRAGILYGVTMGSDAISKLLSVKFDEAVAVAK